MFRRLCLTAACVTLMLALAAPASAGGPTRVAAPIPSPGTLEGFCPFAVHYDLTVNNEYQLVFTDAAGETTHIRTTGGLQATLSNPESGRSIHVNISGPGNLVLHEDGSTTLHSSGSWLFFWAPDQLGPGTEGTMALTHGKIVVHTDADGFHQQILKRTGTSRDVCAILGLIRSAGRRAGGRPQPGFRALSEYISGNRSRWPGGKP